jgi:glycosyltransferase involved in cell wall biosynthesis
MNGGMSYPPGFRSRDRKLNRLTALTVVARRVSEVAHYLAPGKRQAATLLVANERSRNALPRGCKGKVVTLIENGVDLGTWPDLSSVGPLKKRSAHTHFVFMGRLIDLKAVDLLLIAFKDVVSICPAKLTVIGDGPMRAAWEAESEQLDIQAHVKFEGWRSQKECAELLKVADVLVLPSLHEAGGAVVLEAMACGIPVIATNWGGPADYLDETCGILIDPIDRDHLIQGFAQAMVKLAQSPNLVRSMGKTARTKVISGSLNWDHKIDSFIEIYKEAISRASLKHQKSGMFK